MTNTRLDEVSGDNQQSIDEATASAQAEQVTTTSLTDPPFSVQVGKQLCRMREARGKSLEICAQQLHLPMRILRKIESGEYTGIDTAVYLRNYLTCYARCIGVDEDTIEDWVARLAPTRHKPNLVATGGIPHSRYLFERYTSAITYAVLTAVIVVPLVWLGLEGGLNHGLAQMQSLEPAATSQQADATATTVDKSSSKAAAEKPLMASMAPFAALDRVDMLSTPATPTPATPPPAPAPVVATTPAHSLRLQLSEPSWVEITDADGTRLAYKLLPAGTDRTFNSSTSLQISIGNALGAQVQVDGKALDLDAYQRANVAHFRVVSEGAKVRVESN